MATIWALVAKSGLEVAQSGVVMGEAMMFMGVAGVLINAMLMMRNLLPLPPLDGGRVLVSVLPGPMGWQVSRLEPYGFFILLALLYFGILGMVLWPLISGLLNVLALVFSLPPQIFSIL